MPTNRGFAYIPGGSSIDGCENVGDLLAGKPEIGYANTGLTWWGGADEEPGWIVAYRSIPDPDRRGNNTTPLVTKWDTDFIGPTITVSDEDMRIVDDQSGGTNYGKNSALETKPILPGEKIMFTLRCEQIPQALEMWIGFGTTTTNLTNYVGFDSKSVGVRMSGNLYFNNQLIPQFGLPTWTTNSIIDIAIDRTIEKWWYRVDGENWNGIFLQGNPESGDGGLDLSFVTTNAVRLAVTCGEMGIWKIEANSFQIPIGFQAWPVYSYVGFKRSESKTDESFSLLTESIIGGGSQSPGSAKASLGTYGYWTSHPGIVTNDLVLHLIADDPQSYPGTGTTWYDLSGNGNHVQMRNSDTVFVGYPYNGYFETGTGGFFRGINMQNIPPSNSPYTISVWFQIPSGVWNNNGLISIGDSTNGINILRLNGPYYIKNIVDGITLEGGDPALAASKWYNVVTTYDGTERKIYRNGDLIATDSIASYTVNHTIIQIGNTLPVGQGTSECLQGNIAQVLIYDVALNSTQIIENFDATKSKFDW
jgi:hypothetical protein